MNSGQTQIRPHFNDTSASARVEQRPDGSITVVLAGEIDHDGVATIERTLQQASTDARGVLRLDCAGVTFVDSAGLRSILQAQITASDRGVRFALVNPAETVSRLLQLTGLDALISADD